MKKLSVKQLESHIKKNTTGDAGMYSAVVVIAMLFKKLYGDFPKGIGLLGAQAEFADSMLHRIPEPKPQKE